MQTITWQVPDISCGHCVKTIMRELSPVEGVSDVVAKEKEKTVTFKYTDAGALERARAVLAEIGYPPGQN
ncbi:MAG: heavy-metal-associated domain-containing protein [Chloroflexi bacterium]|nr:heavy-metal-associated domain-containing protein [Chloroflexota bacterium]